MQSMFLLVVLCLVVYSEALECGIGKVNSEDVKKTLGACIKNNETLERIWEMAASSATPPPGSMESDSTSSEDEGPHTESARMTKVAKRASNIQEKTVAPPTEAQSNKSTAAPEDATTASPESGDACIVQCVFKELQMTDDNGLPDLTKIVEGLLKNATGRELRIFVQEAAGECFQQMSQESNADPCAYATQLAICLANKGRMNCEDWPAGSLPF